MSQSQASSARAGEPVLGVIDDVDRLVDCVVRNEDCDGAMLAGGGSYLG